MREIDRIVDQLQRAYDGDAWHGPSVRAALAGVTARQADARLSPRVHTICELVLHMTAWTREISRRLQVGTAAEPEEGDWPEGAADDDEKRWGAILAALDAANAQLVEAIRGENEGRLQEEIGDTREPALGSGVSRYVTLHGLIQHHVYHAGQISLLKRALEAAAEHTQVVAPDVRATSK
ncbi:MAG TPA: DinB family protein [Vicinamibacterales bacterium]|nr:DinB family protein [Vicinamibacterales bacterium]